MVLLTWQGTQHALPVALSRCPDRILTAAVLLAVYQRVV